MARKLKVNYTPATSTVTVEQLDLRTLADTINNAHVEVEKSMQRALSAACAAGEALVAVKERLPHGEFLPWLGANCAVSARTAQVYMRLYREWDQVQTINAQRAAHLSIRQALALIQQAPELTPEPKPLTLNQRRLARSFDHLQNLKTFVAKLPTQTPEIQRIQRDLEKLMVDLKAAIATLPD